MKLNGVQEQQPTSTTATTTTTAGATATISAVSSGTTTAAKLRGAALARVLKVGDRVKLAPGVNFSVWGMQPGEIGTVTAIPSGRRAAQGNDPEGYVDVCWDKSGEHCQYMGINDIYHLVLD